METEQSVIQEIHSTLAESSLTLQQKALHLYPEVSAGRQGQNRLRKLLQYLVKKIFFFFKFGAENKATDLDEASTRGLTREKCIQEAGHGGWCPLILSVHQTRRSWVQSPSKIHRETHSPKEQHPETLTMTPYSSHASETENQKASKVSGEWQHTPVSEIRWKRGFQRKTILVQEFEAILGNTGKLPT